MEFSLNPSQEFLLRPLLNDNSHFHHYIHPTPCSTCHKSHGTIHLYNLGMSYHFPSSTLITYIYK